MIEWRGVYLSQDWLFRTNKIAQTNMETASAAELGWTEDLLVRTYYSVR
jgi:hypothetical protein